MNLQFSRRAYLLSIHHERGGKRLTFDHSGWWCLILHCSDTAVMKSYEGDFYQHEELEIPLTHYFDMQVLCCCGRGGSGLWNGEPISSTSFLYAVLTQAFANVLNLNDRSTPWPSAVRAHFLDLRSSSDLVRSASSDPAANLGVAAAAAMAVVLEYDRVPLKAMGFSCRGNADVGAYLGSAFNMTLGRIRKIVQGGSYHLGEYDG